MEHSQPPWRGPTAPHRRHATNGYAQHLFVTRNRDGYPVHEKGYPEEPPATHHFYQNKNWRKFRHQANKAAMKAAAGCSDIPLEF